MRLPRPYPLLLAAAMPLAAQAPAAARPRQDPSTDHRGFWISFGGGTGRQSIDCAQCTPPPVPRLWRSGRSGGFYVAMGTSGNQFKNAPLVGQLMAFLVDAVEAGHDHDADPLTFTAPRTGNRLELATYSRLRAVDPEAPTSVMG